MLESKSSALPLGDAPAGAGGGPPARTRIKPAAPARKPAKLPPCQGFGGRLRGRGGIVIRAPPEARGVPIALVRRVAQPGRALRSGRRGRRFESSLSDQLLQWLAPTRHRGELQRLGGLSGTLVRHDQHRAIADPIRSQSAHFVRKGLIADLLAFSFYDGSKVRGLPSNRQRGIFHPSASWHISDDNRPRS
jgi:hypothetical protein